MEVDARLLGRPPRFTGNEAEWSDWSFQARAYFDTVNPSMADHLDAVETNSERVILLSSLGDVATETARKMFYALTMLLQGPPWLLLEKVERGKGFEAWRLLVERYEGANASREHHMLQSIMRPKAFPQDSGGFEVALNEWEHLVQRWEVLANDILNDAVKRQILLDMAPLRQPSSADLGRRLELRSFALSDHVVPRRFTGLERDSGHIGLRSSANGGGRADTTASQGQRRQGLGEEGLWQAAEEASRRQDPQDLLRVRQAGTPREGLREPTGGRLRESRMARHLVRERSKAKAVARATAK